MNKKKITFGMGGVFMPPSELNAQAVQGYEQAGLDFVCYWDQLCMTFPRTIWTPDIVPAAAVYDIDCYMDAFALMTQAAMVTSRIELGIFAVDALRRPPPVLAQSFLTIDHIAKGRAWFTLGAGEVKQFKPWSLPREKPFGHLEECIKIIRMLAETKDLVNYEGPIWQLRNARLAFDPYDNRCPPLFVACGPGKGIEICGKHSDGWGTFLPPSGSPQWYAEQVQEVKRLAGLAGRDPESMTFFGGLCCIVAPTEAQVQRATENLALRWDVAALVPGPSSWQRFGTENPLGDWSYPRDLVPMDWSREDALNIARQVSPEMVRHLRFCGTPQQVADQIQPYIDAGMNKILIANYGELVLSGDWGDALAGQRVVSETYDIIRRRNGMAPASAG
jgi:phthiodiolone/phenolphthiodiolone dimycocerosates ketoreductase